MERMVSFINYMKENPKHRNPIFVEDVHDHENQVRITFCERGFQDSELAQWIYAAILKEDLIAYVERIGHTIETHTDVVKGHLTERNIHTPASQLIELRTEYYATMYIEDGFEYIQL